MEDFAREVVFPVEAVRGDDGERNVPKGITRHAPLRNRIAKPSERVWIDSKALLHVLDVDLAHDQVNPMNRLQGLDSQILRGQLTEKEVSNRALS